MLRHKQVWLTAGLAATIFVAEAASKKVNQRAIQRLPKSALAAAFQVAASAGSSIYEIRAVHDPHGIGKFYMGREIARVMGPGGIGAGSGFFTFRLAPKVCKSGKVLAVDIQDEMLETIRERAARLHVTNVEEVKGTATDPKLPANALDLVLMVDVYHELEFPYEVMTKVRAALKPNGRVVFIEYRKEDPRVAIKELHKMSLE